MENQLKRNKKMKILKSQLKEIILEVIEEAAAEGKRITTLRKIVKTKTAGKVDRQTVDLYTASGLVKLYDALAEKNQPKFEKMPLGQLVEFMWKRMK
jgi:hypothetical protein